ncbi:alpha-ketoglutarate dehydrogenase subunit KGD4 SCDLUD_002258 [Saccharomycodes ludwigii]|uniref:alpha-ketoglutarate dehydrogenase subunit KGD4 n=1 Tax=Saccharomycodes ludwigii TaxID=36035 RepID=UPI001E8B5054|nr:hypothetical protein SCDLUD_002258 [Saccharomycodes ludwigii]KAH3900805.1 hypothetical protein SCDLUD_002258 [Saccharomycodes ludwigii]
MNPTAVKLATAAKSQWTYVPMIKFLGPKIHYDSSSKEIKPHPFSAGLLPTSKDLISVPEFLSKQRPFKVVPYEKKTATVKTTSKTDKQTTFTNRPLQDGEVSSINNLPLQYRFKPIEPLEMDIIEGGGVEL